MRGEYDMLLLVAAIKGLTFKFDGHKYPSNGLHDAKRVSTFITRWDRLKISSTWILSRIRSQS